jgi:hypothetical protein
MTARQRLPEIDQPASAPRETISRRLGRNLLIVALFFAIYTAFVPRITAYLNPLTGDEPFYVMTAISLWQDHDLNEANNYAQRDYDAFYPPDPLPADWQGWPAFPRDLPPHTAHADRPGIYSKHGLGVAVLIMPPYVLGGRDAIILLLNLVAALVALNIVLLAERYGHTVGAALALAATLALANPLWSYAYLIFPEMFAALAIIYVYRRGCERANNTWQWLGCGLALAILPWLHARFIPAVLGLALILLPGFWREPAWRRRLSVLLPPLLAAGALLAFYFYIYGQPFPDTRDHAGFSDFAGTVNGFFGLFLDEQWGLLIHAPIYLLAAMTGGVLWRRRRNDALALLAPIVPYLLLVAFYRVWWGEWGPPARYLAPIAPLAIAPLACWTATTRRSVAIIITALFALPGFVIMAGFLAAPQLMYNQPDGHNALFTSWAAQFGHPWPKRIPSFQFYALSPVRLRAIWSIVLVWLIAIPGLAAYWAVQAVPPEEVASRRTDS